MRHNLNRAASVLTSAVLAAMIATTASAGDKFSFPSSNGATIAAPTQHFGAPASDAGVAQPSAGVALGVSANGKVPLSPLYAPNGKPRFEGRPQGNDAYAYRFLTQALATQAFSNYAADYYRLFAPNYAVTAWTDRVSGIIDVGYGSAIDSWTAGAHYLNRVRGPRVRRDSPPDLSTMPVFRAHPELETQPTFQND